MSKTRYLVNLRRRGKKATLTMNGGELFKDRELAMIGVWFAFRDGWKSAEIITLDQEEDGRLITRLIEVEEAELRKAAAAPEAPGA